MTSPYVALPDYENDELPQYQEQDIKFSLQTPRAPRLHRYHKLKTVEMLHHRRLIIYVVSLLMILSSILFLCLMFMALVLPSSISEIRCVKVSQVHASSHSVSGCLEETNIPSHAVKVSDAATELLYLQTNMEAHLSAYRKFMDEKLRATTEVLSAIKGTLDASSKDLAFIRSLLKNNAAEELVCDIRCVETMTQYFQAQGSTGPVAGIRDLSAHLEAMHVEMSKYAAFLLEMGGKVDGLLDKISLSRQLGSNAGTASSEAVQLGGIAVPIGSISSPQEVLYEGSFFTTECLVRHGEKELEAVVIESKSPMLSFTLISLNQYLAWKGKIGARLTRFPTAYSSTSLHNPALKEVLQKSISALPSQGYEDDKVFSCTYAVKITIAKRRIFDVQSLQCSVEV
jgi:hypothetical protein